MPLKIPACFFVKKGELAIELLVNITHAIRGSLNIRIININ